MSSIVAYVCAKPQLGGDDSSPVEVDASSPSDVDASSPVGQGVEGGVSTGDSLPTEDPDVSTITLAVVGIVPVSGGDSADVPSAVQPGDSNPSGPSGSSNLSGEENGESGEVPVNSPSVI